MTVEQARVIKAGVSTPDVARPSAPRTNEVTRVDLARRIPGVIVDAHVEAERIVAEARAHAEQLLAEASATAAAGAESAARQAREREIARVAAEVLVARSMEEQSAERGLARTVELAALLAERLIGEAIAVAPARVEALARGALEETRGARQVRIEACPEDVPSLQELLTSLGEGVAVLEPSPELGRGSLVVHTELGRVDARLAPQLSRLAEALREALASSGVAGGGGSSRA